MEANASLHCKLVPVQYREYENGLLAITIMNKRAKISIIMANDQIRA